MTALGDTIISEAKLNDKAEKFVYDVMERLSSNGDEIINALDKFVALEKSGLLDELIKLAKFVANLTAMMQEIADRDVEEIITKNAEVITSIGLLLANNRVKSFVNDVEEALLNMECKPTGLMDLLKAMREPEVKKAIGFLVGFLREFGKRL